LIMLISTLLSLVVFQTPALEAKPNVVIIFTDDAGYADFSFQGSKTHLTPHIDSIAIHGTQFTNGYVSASVCSPSRAGLLTGRYQQRFGHESNLPGAKDKAVPDSIRGLPVSELTIADLLKENGYATGMIGKWHLGMEPQFHPTQRGFGEFFGMLSGGSPYHPGAAKNIECSYKEVDSVKLPYLTDAFGDEAVDFVTRHKAEQFFLYLSFNAPHTPMHARPDYLAEAKTHFKTESRAVNAAMTRSLDENVGKVLEALQREGLTDNTLIFFLNDNGGAMPYNASLNAPLRGTKGTCLEGGIRVPFSVQWPAKLPTGRVESRPVISLDILPTIMSAAGITLPTDRVFDGVNLAPFLTNGWAWQVLEPHPTLFWKLNWAAAIRKGDWKLVRTPDDQHWLFNLSIDSAEKKDLFESEPKIAKELLAELQDWESQLMDPIWTTSPQWREHSLQRYSQETVNGFQKN
jgi:arylsulfatase A-like enzyme